MRPARRPCARILLLAALLPLACAPSLGPFRLPAVTGRVVAAGSGAPVPHAEVLQWYRGSRRASDAHPVHHSRSTRADAQGRFAFPAVAMTSPRSWFSRTDGPVYGVFTQAHGFQRPRAVADGGQIVLRLTPADAAARRAAIAPFCNQRPGDIAGQRIAELACPGGSSEADALRP